MEKARAGTTLVELIEKLGPPGVARKLEKGPGFGVQIERKSAPVTAIPGRPGCYVLGDSGIEAEVSLSFSPCGQRSWSSPCQAKPPARP